MQCLTAKIEETVDTDFRSDFYPLLVAGGSPTSPSSWVFFTQHGTKHIYHKNDLLYLICPLCDGNTNWSTICTNLSDKVPIQEMEELLRWLIEHKIITDSNHIFEGFLHYLYPGNRLDKFVSDEDVAEITSRTSLPSLQNWSINLSPKKSILGALAAARKTTYSFSNSPLSQSAIIDLLWSMYGVQGYYDERLPKASYTTPSGGGLYAMRLDLFLFRSSDELFPGHYLWHPQENCLENLRNEQIEEIKNHAFIPNNTYNNMYGLITVSADMNRIAEKYGNKAFALAFLEAGHIMQNAYLHASEKNIGYAELLGFKRSLFEKIINQTTEEYSYRTVICGIFGAL